MHKRTRSQVREAEASRLVASASSEASSTRSSLFEVASTNSGASSASSQGLLDDTSADIVSTVVVQAEDADDDEPDVGIDVNAAPPPPSLKSGILNHSYSYFSPIPKSCLDPTVEVILGVDEAGRGPVLGAMVYGIAYCLKSYSEPLRELGFADSKALTAQKRSHLLGLLYSEKVTESEDDDQEATINVDEAKPHRRVGWATRVITPQDISAGMLRSTPYNLNAQSIDSIISLIAEVLSAGVNVTEIFVDPVGPTGPLHTRLSRHFPGITFTIEPKADAIYPVVGAASIAAKVTRDWVIERWHFAESGLDASEGLLSLGSGYPSDPRTKEYMASAIDPVFGFGQLVRFSWQTVKTILDGPPGTKGRGRAVSVIWVDDLDEKRKRGGLKRYWNNLAKKNGERIDPGHRVNDGAGLVESGQSTLGDGLKWDKGLLRQIPVRTVPSF